MIISRGRRYIFAHAPKTGGTALALALEARAKADDILIGDTPKALRRRRRLKGVQAAGRLWKHSTLADVEGLISRAEMAELYCVSLVRNPWDRLVSYYHWLQTQTFDHPAVRLAQATDFSTFLNAPMVGQSFQANPYAHYLTDGAGVELANLYIRLEQLADDIRPFEAHLGFSLSIDRVNASDRGRDWRPYYSDADAALVARFCAADIARFGYGFDPA
ncbi:Type II secretory pathway, pullulanase PulA [Marivivens marinus]|uniref:Type II secretory pathway, pullulanase PulA n=1 Tax=Marivivens marinus TaxID=3110173 RepID=UPI003B84AADF